MTNQEIIALIKQEDLKSVLSYLVAQCNGELEAEFEDYDDEHLMTLSVFSEYFTKKHLDVLFQYAYRYNEIIFRPKEQKIEITLEVIVNKAFTS
jgi:predicted nucleotidyltransferase